VVTNDVQTFVCSNNKVELCSFSNPELDATNSVRRAAAYGWRPNVWGSPCSLAFVVHRLLDPLAGCCSSAATLLVKTFVNDHDSSAPPRTQHRQDTHACCGCPAFPICTQSTLQCLGKAAVPIFATPECLTHSILNGTGHGDGCGEGAHTGADRRRQEAHRC
jgi:hypothetical protein